MVKATKKLKRGDDFVRPPPLSAHLTQTVAKKSRTKNIVRAEHQEKVDGQKDGVVDEVLSSKILKQVRQQQKDLIHEQDDDNSYEKSTPKTGKAYLLQTRLQNSDVDSDEDDFVPDVSDYEPQIKEEDEKALEKFMLPSKSSKTGGGISSSSRLLSDIIMEKIEEKRFEVESQMSQSGLTKSHMEDDTKNLDPRLVDMYKNVGKVLSTYRSGRLPKAFKIVPKLTNWEQILFLTSPERWTAASIYHATKMFVSGLNAKMCQRFLSLILLPRVRDDIAEYKKLNFHLYQALKKALYKPAAFFKAILLPLCENGDCSLREATIIGSLLTKCSVPYLHAAAAMLKIAEMDYSGTNSLFLRLLIDKKYTLPFRVVDGLVNHFIRFMLDERQLPVLWHQSFLSFCQRYKNDLSTEQKEQLLDLIKKHYHHQISPEIRREITNAEPRDLEDQEPMLYDESDEDIYVDGDSFPEMTD